MEASLVHVITLGVYDRGKMEWAGVTSFVSLNEKCQNRELANLHQSPMPCRQTLKDTPTHLKYVSDSRRLQAFDTCSLQRVFAARITFEKPHSEKQRLLFATAKGRKGCCRSSLKPAPCSAPVSSWLSRAAGSAQLLHYEFSPGQWKESIAIDAMRDPADDTLVGQEIDCGTLERVGLHPK